MFIALWCLGSLVMLTIAMAILFVIDWIQMRQKVQREAEEHHQWQKRRRCRSAIDFDERPIIDYDGDGLGGWSS